MGEVWIGIVVGFLLWILYKNYRKRRHPNNYYTNNNSDGVVWKRDHFEVEVQKGMETTPSSNWAKLDTPIKRRTTIDEHGYKRNGYGRLIHRDKAEKLIYNKGDFDLEFWEYDVHHKDRNKLNNRKDNLEILTREEHKKKHGIF